MKIDARTCNLHFDGKITILLNGVEMREVVEADDAEGYVIRYCPGVEARLSKMERLDGKVEIVGIPRPPRYSHLQNCRCVIVPKEVPGTEESVKMVSDAQAALIVRVSFELNEPGNACSCPLCLAGALAKLGIELRETTPAENLTITEAARIWQGLPEYRDPPMRAGMLGSQWLTK